MGIAPAPLPGTYRPRCALIGLAEARFLQPKLHPPPTYKKPAYKKRDPETATAQKF